MKKCILGLCILGLTNLICAQNELAMSTTDLSDINIKTFKSSKINNEQYIKSSLKGFKNLAAGIKKLQKIAADYDIKSESIYSNKKTITYDVVFQSNKNYIKAIYDHNGTILSSEEYYEDVRLPSELISQLAKENPGWAFDKSNCKILFSKHSEAMFIYNVKLKKGNISKLITL